MGQFLPNLVCRKCRGKRHKIVNFFHQGPDNGFTKRFLGFSMYVSNSTDRTKGKLCFKDTGFTINTIPAVLNITCFAHGQYVIYYNERLQGVTYPDDYSEWAFNELCEVEVFGEIKKIFYSQGKYDCGKHFKFQYLGSRPL